MECRARGEREPRLRDMTTIRQILAGLALCLVACGAPNNGGTGGGSGAGGGSPNSGDCQTRCETHFKGCGFANPSAGCSTLCPNLDETEMSCIEHQSCAEDPNACMTSSNTGGGSGSTGGGSGSTGGGNGNTCAVPAAALKVSLPYSTTKGVLFTAGSSCSGVTGYNWVWNSRLFVDVTTSSQSTIHSAGSLYEIEYRFEQRALSSSDKSSASNETGIPVAAIDDGEFLSRSNEAPVVVDGLPSDVTLVAQITSNAPPSIKFVSSSSSALSTLQQRIDGNGVQVNIAVQNMNGSVNRTAEFKLKSGALTLLGLRF